MFFSISLREIKAGIATQWEALVWPYTDLHCGLSGSGKVKDYISSVLFLQQCQKSHTWFILRNKREIIFKIVSTLWLSCYRMVNLVLFFVFFFTYILSGGKVSWKKPKDSLSTSHPEACQHSLIPRLIWKKIKEIPMATWLNFTTMIARQEAKECKSSAGWCWLSAQGWGKERSLWGAKPVKWKSHLCKNIVLMTRNYYQTQL